MQRRNLLMAGAGLAGLPFTGGATAAPFPSQIVKVVVPFPPGGPTDTMARLIAVKLQERWGRAVMLEYKPGASTIIGMDMVAKAAADGHTFGVANSSLVINPFLKKSLPYDTTADLAGITQLVVLQQAIVARPDAPFNTLTEMIAWAKKHPGKLTYGTPGSGSTSHLAGELLQREAGFNMLHSPFKGSAPAHTELLGGRLDVVIDPYLSVSPYVKANRMRLVATLGDTPIRGTDYPVAKDVVRGLVVEGLLGFVAPRATPAAVVQQIQADTRKVLSDSATRERIEDLGMQVVASSPQQFDAFIDSEMKRWSKVIAQAGIQPD